MRNGHEGREPRAESREVEHKRKAQGPKSKVQGGTYICWQAGRLESWKAQTA
jgi:hypothetical protein